MSSLKLHLYNSIPGHLVAQAHLVRPSLQRARHSLPPSDPEARECSLAAPLALEGLAGCPRLARPSSVLLVGPTLAARADWGRLLGHRACITRECHPVDRWGPTDPSARTALWARMDLLDSWIGWIQGKSIGFLPILLPMG